MSQPAYDLDILKKTGDVDVESATRTLSFQLFFDELHHFVVDSRHYLRGFTPTVVIFSEDDRKRFLAEVNKIRRTLVMLGMVPAAAKLSDLEDAIHVGSTEALDDGLTTFFAEMEIIAKRITSAIVPQPSPYTSPVFPTF